MVSGKRKVMFFTGILLMALSLFLPFASGKESLMAWDFSLAGVSLPFIMVPLALACIAAFTFGKVFLTLALSLALLLLDLACLFLRSSETGPEVQVLSGFLQSGRGGLVSPRRGALLIVVAAITLFRDRKRAPYLFLLPMLAE